MDELQVCLNLIIVTRGNGLLAPEEWEVVREGGEEDSEEKASRCNRNHVSALYIKMCMNRAMMRSQTNVRPIIIKVEKELEPR